VIRQKRVESTSSAFAVAVTTWDDETGAATKVEYDERGRTLRRAVTERYPRERWEDDVVGETTWFDEGDRVLRREPVLLGRSPL
jgi:YD repeat-containing protein